MRMRWILSAHTPNVTKSSSLHSSNKSGDQGGTSSPRKRLELNPGHVCGCGRALPLPLSHLLSLTFNFPLTYASSKPQNHDSSNTANFQHAHTYLTLVAFLRQSPIIKWRIAKMSLFSWLSTQHRKSHQQFTLLVYFSRPPARPFLQDTSYQATLISRIPACLGR